jgi:uroporphyrinogen decarboxylase
MTSKEIVAAALNGRPVPRVPVGPLAVHFCAGLAGYTLRQYSTGARALASSVIRYCHQFRPDVVWVSADTWISAEAMGAAVGATDHDQPLGGVGEPVVSNVADIDRIPPPNVGSQGRYPMMIEALERVVEAVGNEVFIAACFDQYPFSIASALMGISQLMLRLHDDPQFVRALMVRCEDYALAYARALANAGADMLSGGDSPASLLGPRAYAAEAFPAEKRLINRLKNATAKPVSLHICGDATRILPLMATTGADVLEIDHAVDLALACRLVGPKITLWGNIDPVGVLAQSAAARVTQTALAALDAARKAGHCRFVLSSGCTLAVETPHANLEALLRAPVNSN